MMKKEERLDSEKFYEIITKEDFGWQSIIYDLIRTEQLDPWDIDLAILADRYLQVVQKMEEMNFFVSSKVLLACSLLLRMKSEILNSTTLREIDNLIYGKKEEVKKIFERIEIDDVPILIPKTPLPRFKKVSLDDLMFALNKAIESETRRIKRDVKKKHAQKLSSFFLPRPNRISLKERISIIMKEFDRHFKELGKKEVAFSDIARTKEEKISYFLPLLHLSHQERLFLKQLNHFEEIFIKIEREKEMIDILVYED